MKSKNPPRPRKQTPRPWKQIRQGKITKLRKDFKFSSHRGAFRFVSALTRLAESQDHHPDIGFTWRRVTVTWWTHSQRGLTPLDHKMARQTDRLIKSPSPQ